MPILKNTASPQYELEMISLEQIVPKDYLVRKVAKTIYFEFIRDEVAHFYCHDNARPAIDPIQSPNAMLPCDICKKIRENDRLQVI